MRFSSISLIILLLTALPAGSSVRDSADEFYSNAMKNYLEGNTETAILDLEKALELAPSHDNARELLVKILVQKGTFHYSNREYLQCFLCLERAYELDPENRKIIRMRNAARKNIHGTVTGKTGGSPASSTIIISGIAIVLLLIVSSVATYFYLVSRTRPPSSSAGIPDKPFLVRDENPVEIPVSPSRTAGKDSFREMIENPNARLRARGVELLEENLLSDSKMTGDMAENLLEPFVSDTNNRVMANAVKALYRYNQKKAMSALNRMIRSEDKWMRASGSWVLGQIDYPDALKILQDMLKREFDSLVTKRIFMSIEDIHSRSKKNFTPLYGTIL